MTKKAQGLPLNVIIIAIIVLIVMVVLVAIFTGRINFGKEEFDLEKDVCLEFGGMHKKELRSNQQICGGGEYGERWVMRSQQPTQCFDFETFAWYKCLEWRPKDECEKGNPRYIEKVKCTEFFQEKQINLTAIGGYNFTIDLATANKDMYACGKYESICRQKTSCELNPEAEGCVCDEFFYEVLIQKMQEFINDFEEGKTIPREYLKEVCTKAHDDANTP